MFSEDHLALRLIHFNSRQEWVNQTKGILFIFPKSDGVEYVSPPVTLRLSPGDVLVLNVTSEVRLRADNDHDGVFSFFSASLERLFPLFGSGEISLLQNVADGFKATRLYAASNALARQCHQLLAEVPPQFGLEHRGQLLRVVATILGAECRTVQSYRPGFVDAEQRLRQVLEKLSVDELTSLSVHELATRFGSSKRHLSRLFHQYFGFSVAALKMEMRLLKAVSLLRDPDAKIISVAEECGFNYLGLFNTCFKKRFGVTPSQSRKMMAEAEVPAVRLPDRSPVQLRRSAGVFTGSSGNPEPWPPPEASPAGTRLATPAKLMITVRPFDAVRAHESDVEPWQVLAKTRQTALAVNGIGQPHEFQEAH